MVRVGGNVGLSSVRNTVFGVPLLLFQLHHPHTFGRLDCFHYNWSVALGAPQTRVEADREDCLMVVSIGGAVRSLLPRRESQLAWFNCRRRDSWRLEVVLEGRIRKLTTGRKDAVYPTRSALQVGLIIISVSQPSSAYGMIEDAHDVQMLLNEPLGNAVEMVPKEMMETTMKESDSVR